MSGPGWMVHVSGKGGEKTGESTKGGWTRFVCVTPLCCQTLLKDTGHLGANTLVNLKAESVVWCTM